MSQSLAVIYGDEFMQYDLGPDHPFNPLRLLLTYQLMEQIGLLSWPGVLIKAPELAPIEEVQRFHNPDYINYLRLACQDGVGFLDGGDTPAFPGCLQSSRYIVGGSILAADLVMNGTVDHAFNIGGGLHHAHPERASGFCILNDIAVAIQHLKANYGVERIAYLDIDAHHGDGVMYGFYSDGGVLDIDFHEDGRYLFPGTGRVVELGKDAGLKLKINIPLPPYCGDLSYLMAFRELVPPLIRRTEPQILLLQCGADAHAGDPLSDLNLSNQTYGEVVETLHQLAHEVSEGRLLVFGGGGYNPGNVAVCWAMVASLIVGAPLPESVPQPWRLECERLTGEAAPTRFQEPETRDNHLVKIRDTVSYLKGLLALN